MSENNFQKRLLEELILLFDPVVRGAASPERVYELIGCLGWNGNALFGPPPNAVIDAWAVAASAVVEVERTLTPPPESLSDLSKSLGAVDTMLAGQMDRALQIVHAQPQRPKPPRPPKPETPEGEPQ